MNRELLDRLVELQDREDDGWTLTPNENEELRELLAQENAAFIAACDEE